MPGTPQQQSMQQLNSDCLTMRMNDVFAVIAEPQPPKLQVSDADFQSCMPVRQCRGLTIMLSTLQE